MTTRQQKVLSFDDVVAKASMDGLTGSWPLDENGEIEEGAAPDSWTVECLGGGGALDKQAEIDATEKALDSLLAHGVVEDMKLDDVVSFKFLTTRWEKEHWRVEDEGPICGTRVQVGRAQRGVLSWVQHTQLEV